MGLAADFAAGWGARVTDAGAARPLVRLTLDRVALLELDDQPLNLITGPSSRISRQLSKRSRRPSRMTSGQSS